MTGLTDRIVEVLRRHVSAQTEHWETKLRCECGRGDFTSKLEYAAHVAEQITAALGLTEIWHIPTTICQDGAARRPVNSFDSLQNAEKCRDEQLPEAQIYSQWVSTWSVVQEQP